MSLQTNLPGETPWVATLLATRDAPATSAGLGRQYTVSDLSGHARQAIPWQKNRAKTARNLVENFTKVVRKSPENQRICRHFNGRCTNWLVAEQLVTARCAGVALGALAEG